jgi:hypothetical protein
MIDHSRFSAVDGLGPDPCRWVEPRQWRPSVSRILAVGRPARIGPCAISHTDVGMGFLPPVGHGGCRETRCWIKLRAARVEALLSSIAPQHPLVLTRPKFSVWLLDKHPLVDIISNIICRLGSRSRLQQLQTVEAEFTSPQPPSETCEANASSLSSKLRGIRPPGTETKCQIPSVWVRVTAHLPIRLSRVCVRP